IRSENHKNQRRAPSLPGARLASMKSMLAEHARPTSAASASASAAAADADAYHRNERGLRAIVVVRGPATPIGIGAGLRIFGLPAMAFAVATFLFSLIAGPLPVRSRRIVGPLLSEPVVFTPVDFGPS